MNKSSKASLSAKRKIMEGNAVHKSGETSSTQRKKEVDEKPYFKKRNISFIFNGNYGISLLMVLLIIINSIGRAFVGTYGYIFTNLVFILLYLFIMTYVEPLSFSSNRKNYVYPKMNLLYTVMQKNVTQLLTRLGKNLSHKPRTSIITGYVILFISYLLSLLFYNSNFEFMFLPFLLIYVARVFASNSFNLEYKFLNKTKWIWFILLLINLVLSVFWKTPIDYSLVLIISLINTISIWFKNMEIYYK